MIKGYRSRNQQIIVRKIKRDNKVYLVAVKGKGLMMDVIENSRNYRIFLYNIVY